MSLISQPRMIHYISLAFHERNLVHSPSMSKIAFILLLWAKSRRSRFPQILGARRPRDTNLRIDYSFSTNPEYELKSRVCPWIPRTFWTWELLNSVFGVRDDLSFSPSLGVGDDPDFSLSLGVGSRRQSRFFAKFRSRESETISIFR